MSARRGTVQQYKNQTETLVLRMQFFCLDPKYANYKEICANPKIQHDQSQYIDIWKLACLHQYGKFWNIPETELIESETEFAKEMRKLSSRLLVQPTATNLDRMWYVFFATGDIGVLRAVFEVSGNDSAKKNLRIAASDQFANFRDEYRRRIQDALDRDPNYFRNHEIPIHNTQTVFDRFQEEIDKATAKLDEDEPDVRGVLTRIVADAAEAAEAADDAGIDQNGENIDGTDIPESSGNRTGNGTENRTGTGVKIEKKNKEDKRISDLADKFDEIAKDVLGDKYLTKPVSQPKKHRK